MLCDVSNINHPVERAIQKYKIHPSISSETTYKEVVSLDTNKSTHANDVPTKIVKDNADLFSIFVCYNQCF